MRVGNRFYLRTVKRPDRILSDQKSGKTLLA